MEQMKRKKTPEKHFFTAAPGYRITDHKHNKDVRKELGITENVII
jgi:hypothetical protein